MQSKTHSVIEIATSTISGLIVSWLITFYIMPWWGFKPSIQHAIEITAVYTVASLIRGYFIRRLFNEVDVA